MNDTTKTIDRIALQRAEFDAFDVAVAKYHALCNTPIVDDDYPQVRHYFEGALASFIKAMIANGRFEKGNRYGLKEL